ncbi:MAG: glycosyltransferase family 4 protein [Hyphomonas sp.]
MILIAILAVPFAVSLFVCWLMIRHGPKDAPDGGRKTQAAPVPSSGGLGVLAGVAAGLGALALAGWPVLGHLAWPPLAGIAVFTLVAALAGWADDVYGLSAPLKLIVLSGFALISIYVGSHPTMLWIGSDGIWVPSLLGIIGAATFVFVMANAVNFLDGANGIAMGVSLIILMALGLMFIPTALDPVSEGPPKVLMALLFAASASLAGFLVWNLQGKLFAGDAGSLSVGGLIGGASVAFAVNGPVLVPLTLCLPILIDVFLTLAWRARHGRPLMQAHRDHAYQLLLRAGWPHGKVARLWWGMTAICAGSVIAGPFAHAAGIYGTLHWPLDVIVFVALLGAGSGLWIRQRVTLGRSLAASGR